MNRQKVCNQSPLIGNFILQNTSRKTTKSCTFFLYDSHSHSSLKIRVSAGFELVSFEMKASSRRTTKTTPGLWSWSPKGESPSKSRKLIEWLLSNTYLHRQNTTKLIRMKLILPSVTRFGEIWKFYRTLAIRKGSIYYLGKFWTHLANSLCYWTNFHSCKWPNIEKVILSCSHLLM